MLLIKGFIMGSADIVPGVSGGTMALIVGIYKRLIDAIKSFGLDFLRRLGSFKFREAFTAVHWKFMLMLLTGILAAIFFFTKVVPLQIYMFTHPELVYGLFFGLILGSIYILVKAMESFTWTHGLFVLIGTAIGFWVVTLVPADTSETSLFVFFSGSLAICAMILPGISGSYILLILRKYEYILSQIGKLGTTDTAEGLLALLPFVLGAVVGLAVFSRILSWLLDRYYAITLAVLIGFLIGSLYVIWPYQDRAYETFVADVETVSYDSELAADLQDASEDQNLPEYRRLGESVSSGDEKMVEVETVKKKLISSEPFIPVFTVSADDTPGFRSGILGIFIGLFLVGALDYIRDEA